MFKATALALALAAALPAGAVELSAAINSAQANDPGLASAMANRDAAGENVALARARLLPQLSFQATEQQTDQTTVSALGASDFRGRSRNAALQLRQGLFRPRDWAGVEIGRAQAEYGEFKLSSAQSDLWNRTVVAWIDMLGATRMQENYARGVATAQTAAEQEKRRFEKGDGTRDAAAEAAAQLAQVRAQLADAQSDLLSKRQAFQLLTRMEPTGFDRYAMPAVSALPGFAEELPALSARIVDANPELQAARINERINERKLAQAAADHLPTVDLIGSKSEAANDTTNTIGTRYRSQQLGLQVVVPIYQGGGVLAAERQAAAFYAAASADRAALYQRLRNQVATDWQSLEGLRGRIVAAQELLASARELRRAAEMAVKAGMRTWSDVSNADQNLARREADLIGMTAAYLKTQARILAMLPTTDPHWERWTRELWLAASR